MGSAQGRKVVVIGGGPGGYVAAIRAAQLGASVTLVEKQYLGGTCLNVGCIPTKAILHPAEIARHAKEGAACGVHVKVEKIDWDQVLAFKAATVEKLVGGVTGLLKGNNVQVIKGTASFVRPKTLQVEKEDGSKELMEADKIIIATGSVPVMPPIEGLRESKYVMDSTGALSMSKLPSSMVIIGGGVIGIEMACALQAFGCEVTIVEALPRLAPSLDGEMAAMLAKSLENQGIKILLGHKVMKIVDQQKDAQVILDRDGTEIALTAETVLCAVGRRPFIDGLNPDAAGIRNERGRILVNEELETNIPGVYAIGDCLGQIMLAHTASAMGEIAAENAMGEHNAYRPSGVPAGIYCFPEMASVGLTEEQVKEQKIPYHVGKFPLAANGRSLIANGGDGMVKVIIGDELDEILGVHILGPYAMEMIGEAAVAIQTESTVQELIDTIHAHPTVTEAVREAALASEGRAIHMRNKTKKG